MLLVLLGYSAISFAYFGARLLPHPGRVAARLRAGPADLRLVVRVVAARARHGTNPLVSHAIYATDGYNLAWTTSVPAIAVAFTPVTVLFGPVVVLQRRRGAAAGARGVDGVPALPPPDGLDVGVARRRLPVRLLELRARPAAAGPPARHRRLPASRSSRSCSSGSSEGELDRRGLAWRLGALLGLQLWISTEVALTLTLALAAGLALAFWRMRAARPRLRSALAPIAAGYGLALVLAAPLLVYALLGLPDRSFTAPESGTTDAVNLVLPARR